ncbi:MAG: hypothetical protein C5B54_04895 [Acidobacteria bacterium]|nr:MAG: hypothetical protein C5B54_04895 [Acidobacteriota bacterium]
MGGGIFAYYHTASSRQVRASEKNQARTYIIGLDGATWNLMDPLMKKGKLPNLKKLIDNGVRASLQSQYPAHSPFLWTSIATGKTRQKHGIGDFTVKSDGENDQLVTGNIRRVKAFWNMLTDKSVTVSVVNWWVTFPPEKIDGVMISDHYRLGNYKKYKMVVTYPALLQKDLPHPLISKHKFEADSETFKLPEMKDVTEGADTGFDKLLHSYPMYWCQDAAVRQAAKYVLQHDSTQVFAVVYRITDVSSHFFWCFLPMQVLEEARKKEKEGTLTKDDIVKLDDQFADIIEPVYSYADQLVGDVVQSAPAGSSFIVVSDHGFGYYQGSWSHTTQPSPPDGILILSGGPFRKGIQISGASIYDVTPTLLYQLHLPVADDFDGKVLVNAFNEDFTRSHSIAHIKSWETGTKSAEKPVATPDDKEMMEDLRSLGYLQ